MCVSYPLAEVAGEDEVAGEGVGEGGVEVEHLEQRLPLDDVQVAVGQRTHVGTRMGQGGLLPEHISKHITFTWGKGGRERERGREQEQEREREEG